MILLLDYVCMMKFEISEGSKVETESKLWKQHMYINYEKLSLVLNVVSLHSYGL